jgi:uncharacterized protein DUF4932
MKEDRVSWITKAFVMSALVLVCIGVGSSAFAANNPPVVYRANVGRVTIEVDPRVELISIVFRLAGNPEFNNGTLRPYVKAIEKHFGDFDTHAAVKMATELRNTCSMSCDGPMSLAVHIDRAFQLRKTHEQWPATLDKRWQKKQTKEFLEKVRQFAVETKFDEFFKAQSEIYWTGIDSCKDLIGPLNISDWLMEYFGVQDCGDLRLALGFVNGFCNYGVRFVDGQTNEKYAIVGMRPFDPANTIIFRPMQIGTTMHEFCHSFANPVVAKHMNELRPVGERLYAAHEAAMRMQGYQRWESLMYETAVRACVGAFVRQKFEPVYLGYYLEGEVHSGFVWTEDTTRFLEQYEASRGKYPTFESFFPIFVKYLSDYTVQAK